MIKIIIGRNYCKVLLTFLFLLAACFAHPQSLRPVEDSTSRFAALVQKIQQAYQKARYLEFQIRYYYANADRPGRFLDSLSGEIQMDKGHSRFVLDGVETVLTDKYAIRVMNEDKMIYLSAARHDISANPLSMLDSLFAHIGGVKTSITRQEQQDVMTLILPPGQPYSQLEIRIDGNTGFFKRIIYSVNTARVVGREMVDRPDNPTPYQSQGRMEIVFTNYRQGHFDDRVFKEENFVNKIAAGGWEPSDRYKDYHIFLASSNL